MSIDLFLSKLTKVKARGSGRWIACCSAHEDKNPSMTIAELPDGRVLVHCFAGCGINEIVGAVGLSISDLMPERVFGDRHAPIRRPYPADAILKTMATESLIVAVAASNLANGIQLSVPARERLWLASSRITEARRIANGDE